MFFVWFFFLLSELFIEINLVVSNLVAPNSKVHGISVFRKPVFLKKSIKISEVLKQPLTISGL